MLPNIYVKADEVLGRLQTLGLNHTILTNIVRRGQYAHAACTANDPPLYPGFTAWAQMIRASREYLLPKGWSRSNENNYCLVIDPQGEIAIAIATGDEGTGQSYASPTTKSSKGPRTVDVVIANQNQLLLPLDCPPIPEPAITQDENRMTWILLVHRGAEGVRSELSLPLSINNDGYIDAWRERIMLGMLPNDPDLDEIKPSTNDQPDITIDIKRRA
ncbi:hypothetical protein AB8810_03565 [Xanthomonas sp. NCPPB 3005]|jgi:hypothetical protein|uniref:hypothetical protein n=1 Tax=Xanthomonas sp. NCPPB 3005 TaxID=3240913 RepID=UPI003516E89A